MAACSCPQGTCTQVGRLWTSLADYYIRQGMYESARDVYEEGLTTVTTVRDFSLIFDTLTQFEETLLQHKVSLIASQTEHLNQTAGRELTLLQHNVLCSDYRMLCTLLNCWHVILSCLCISWQGCILLLLI